MTRLRVALLAISLIAISTSISVGQAPASLADATPPWPEAFAKTLDEAVFQTINDGVALYNANDPAGCYRLFQGSLRTLVPFLKPYPEYEKEVVKSLVDAEKLTDTALKSIELRKPLDMLLIASRKRPLKPTPPPVVVTPKPEQTKPEAPKPVVVTEKPKPPAVAPTAPSPIVEPKPAMATEAKPAPKPATIVNNVPASKPAEPKPAAPDTNSSTTKPGPAFPADEPTDPTLWARLGGPIRVKSFVQDWLFKASNDPRVMFDRDGKFKLDEAAMLKIELHVVEYLSDHTGGTIKYTGRPIKAMHQAMSITNEQYEAAIEDLRDVLEIRALGPNEIRDLLALLARLKPQFVAAK
jgi:hemoglobin